MSLPYIKFFFRDWDSDRELNVCTLAAQGLWIRMLRVMHEAEPYGFFIGRSGTSVDTGTFARLIGQPLPLVQKLVGELETAGVFSRDENGRIFSRRMVRDADKREKARKFGEIGGNPDLRRGLVPKEDRVRPFKRSDSPAKTQRIFDRSDGHCVWCGRQLQRETAGPDFFHVDHRLPICDGGTNDEENLVASCAQCNHDRARIGWTDSNPGSIPTLTPDTKPHGNTQSPESRVQNTSHTPREAAEVFSLWFLENAQAVGAISGAHLDPKAWIRRDAGIDAATRLLAAYPLDELQTRSQRLFAVKLAGKIRRPLTVAVLAEHWDSADVAGAAPVGSKGGISDAARAAADEFARDRGMA